MENLFFKGKQMVPPAFLFTVLFVLGISGCRTGPQYEVKNYPALVSRQGDMFVSFNIEEDRRILDRIMETRNLSESYGKLLDRTDRLSVSFSSGGHYTAVAEGRYPSAAANIVIGKDSGWKKHKDIFTWWENPDEGIMLSVPVRNLALFSNSSLMPVFDRLSSGERGNLPEPVTAQMAVSPLVISAAGAGSDLFTSLGIESVSVEVDDMNLFLMPPDGESFGSGLVYRVFGYVSCPDKENVSSLYAGLKIFFLAGARAIGRDAVKEVISGDKFTSESDRIEFNGVLVDIEKLLED